MFNPGKIQIKSTLFSLGLKLKEICFPECWDERCVHERWIAFFFFLMTIFFFFKEIQFEGM